MVRNHWSALQVGEALWEGATREEYYLYRRTLPVRILYNDTARVGAVVPAFENGRWSWQLDSLVYLNVPERVGDESRKVGKKTFNDAVRKYVADHTPGSKASSAPEPQ